MVTSFNVGLSLLSSNTPIRREQLSAEGRRILSRLAERPLADSDFLREENGRPYFADRNGDGDFNISHSGSVTAVSLVKGKTLRTGCDVQLMRTRGNTIQIAAHFFSAAERDYIGQDTARFFEIWTLKECFIKLRGLSVFDMAQVPSFIRTANSELGHFCGDTAVPLSFYLYELTGNANEQYMLAIAVEGAEQPRPEMRWFSQDFLPCKSIAEIKAAPTPADTVSPKI